jgi:aldehyde:ferredoxin oxidoreductase
MNKRYKFYKWLLKLAEQGMKDNYLKPRGGCDSCCPRCSRWESSGNKITTVPLNQYTDKRTCSACGYEWIGIFTPAGFIPVPTEGKTK